MYSAGFEKDVLVQESFSKCCSREEENFFIFVCCCDCEWSSFLCWVFCNRVERMLPFARNQLNQMREIQLGSHTIRSHGIKVARTHLHDWIMLLILVALVVGLNAVQPFYRFVGKDMMADLKYPLKGNTVPFWALPLISLLLPMFIFVGYYIRRKDVYDLHHAILGLLFSYLITGVITIAVKLAVGRPRPDFFWRCFPDGMDVYDAITGNVICTGDKKVVKEGHMSFPSGHTSACFSGLGFLSLYLSGKIRLFDRRGHVAKLCIVFLPLLLAALVGISRVDDYWHHWQDVFAGALLGLVVATFCYLQFFPAPHDIDGWGPYAYFEMLAESRNSMGPSDIANTSNAQATEFSTIGQQAESSAVAGQRAMRYHSSNPFALRIDDAPK